MRRGGTGALIVILAAGVQACAGVERRQAEGPRLRRVSPGIAFEMLRDSPEYVLILDLRDPEEFRGAMGHLRGAHNLPVAELSDRLFEVAGHRNRTFLVYCRLRDDECGRQGMNVLLAAGFDGATLIAGGIEAWISQGFGTVGVTVPGLPGGGSLTLETEARAALVADSAEVEAGLPPPPPPVPERGTAYLRLADGSLILPPRRPTDFHIVGRLAGGRFVSERGVRGAGESCEDLRQVEPDAAPAWIELSNGLFYPDQSARTPLAPYVHGCISQAGHFHPDGKEIAQ